MGALTNKSKTELRKASGYSQRPMKALCSIKFIQSNGHEFRWSSSAIEYGDTNNVGHVESRLIESIKSWINANLSQLPEGATILFVCNWSPCRNCMNHTIPDFVKLVTGKNQQTRVRFRFGKFYTAADWMSTGGSVMDSSKHLFWNDQQEAIDAYNNLSKIFGSCRVRGKAISLGDIDGLEAAEVRIKDAHKLIIAQYSDMEKRSIEVGRERLG